MNIQEAKNQVVNTCYFIPISKDEFGEYKIQVDKRPIFLVGPPGVKRIEIMSQAVRSPQAL